MEYSDQAAKRRNHSSGRSQDCAWCAQDSRTWGTPAPGCSGSLPASG